MKDVGWNVEFASKSTVKLGPDIRAKIGQQLRAMYSDVVSQGVPDQFSEILRSLDQVRGPKPRRPSKKRRSGGRMALDPKAVRDVMLAAVPSLRAFAISLMRQCRPRRRSGAGDAAAGDRQSSIPSSPAPTCPAWLFTILRNLFRSEYRKRRREVEDADGYYAETLTSLPDQNSHLEFEEFRRALESCPPTSARP